jgi:hypothetical protein
MLMPTVSWRRLHSVARGPVVLRVFEIACAPSYLSFYRQFLAASLGCEHFSVDAMRGHEPEAEIC